MVLHKGMIIDGLGFKIEITNFDPVCGKVVNVPTRNINNNLFIGDELQFSTKDDYRNCWLCPETYSVGDMKEYVGGWYIEERNGQFVFDHTVP